MIEEGDKLNPYISGTKSTVSAMRLKSVGKNLFDGQWEIGGLNSTGKEITDDEIAFLTIHFSTMISVLNQNESYEYKAVVICNHGLATGNLLAENLNKEIERGTSLIGPHRDDIGFTINDFDVQTYGSQGQQRSVVLALKIGEVDLFKKAGGEETILLLDDVLSEFDEKRSAHLLQFLRSRAGQSFITTASPSWAAEQRWSGGAQVYNISRGKVKID